MSAPYSYPPDRRRLGEVYGGSHWDPLAALINNILPLLVLGALLYGGYRLFGPGLGWAPKGRLAALPMDAQLFGALRRDEVAWTFLYVDPGDARLEIRSGDGPGAPAGATLDLATDGREGYASKLGPDARAALLRTIADDPGEFFDGQMSLINRSMRYTKLEDWPYRPLFAFESPGPTPHQRYLLVFGGNPTTGELEPTEEKVLLEVQRLMEFVKAHPPEPSGTSVQVGGSGSRARRRGGSTGAGVAPGTGPSI